MVLGIKNFNILGVHWKIWLLVGVFSKNQYRVGADGLKRGGLDSLPIQGGGAGGCLARKRARGAFEGEGGLIPQCTLWIPHTNSGNLPHHHPVLTYSG